ncbi:hypothetical protein AM1_B0134 (plasmid) [Acaryochloris marina MBIC11017]|uniref:Uncharacterized protein n=1 Tax=Acaryochloris marina (strain MBIC 11017) TaxID=329726 RepID=A8ZM90_ACAM1|nr:hypothetical protein AM1_B0134 [Acaryochloris marina MBIC11017]
MKPCGFSIGLGFAIPLVTNFYCPWEKTKTEIKKGEAQNG